MNVTSIVLEHKASVENGKIDDTECEVAALDVTEVTQSLEVDKPRLRLDFSIVATSLRAA